MRKFEDYRVPDLLRANTKWIFVLESPHHDEIRLGYPAAGESGKIMSEALFGVAIPFGRLLQENDTIVAGYSVINASCIPLQEICYHEPNLHKEILEISNARYTEQGVVAAKKAIKHALNSPIGSRITQNLKLRIMRQLEINAHGIFIVCGVVAQSIFEVAMSAEGWIHKPVVLNLEGKKVTVFYEYHPSDLSGMERSKWKDTESIRPLLHLLCH